MSSGASSTRAATSDVPYYAFTNFDQVDKIIQQSSRVGFAIPMQDDEFRVVRFNVRGATRAISAMSEAAAKRSKAVPRNTRDKRL